ncbi:MAG: type II toxin-antitoxin system RelE/ParE family toxin [Bradymonadia bacterium]
MSACLWYQRQVPELVHEFRAEVEHTLNTVVQHPELYSTIDDSGTRRALLSKFPYAVYYSLEQSLNAIVVFAILHVARHPDDWKRRR